MPRYILFLVAFALIGCTKTSIDEQPIRGSLVATATASCLGLCAPDREQLFEAMHRQCEWPTVPAIHARGSEKNGLLGVPHAAWRFSCLEVSPETEIARNTATSG